MLNALDLQQTAHRLRCIGVPIVPTLIQILIRLVFNSVVHPDTVIGKGSKLAYGGIAVVIHRRARIGCNVLIGQCVTVGGRSGHVDVPVIEDGVYIGAGAQILGPIVVGKNSVIGANAVVLSDVPANAIVAGVPAKIIRYRGGYDSGGGNGSGD
ncbi:serine acetyltransferase [Cupriavidus sp. CV2]|uniref:serine O-acetyltransferase n=1 Tax=Cupriavidus ulmosensis TaxID=3065913 RepID=UPI00296B5548|nr:serine acetyltransferase [Cupriavidus sp. CV2]MDW3686379.1 serine acetyltransferase [Cupriavidus sp. CV2]